MGARPSGMRRSNEAGFLAPVVMVAACLLLLPLLSLSRLTMEERILALKTSLQRSCARLAEAAAWEWIARACRGDAGLAPPPEPTLPSGEAWMSAPLRRAEHGSWYEARCGARPDRDDLDLDPSTTVVCYDRSFGFTDSPLPAGGPPVYDIRAAGGRGTCSSSLTVTVTHTPFVPPALAALAAAGRLVITGPAVIDGRPHGADGAIMAAAETGIPGVASGGPAEAGEGVVVIDGREPVADGGIPLDLLRSPALALGLPAGSPCLDKTRPVGIPPLPWSGLVVLPEGYRGPVDGAGTVVVHNPRFDPARHQASLDHAAGRDNPDYDSAYSHLDPSNAPAVLEPWGEGRFTGLVVADAMRPGGGRLEVVGQVLILSRDAVSLGMSGGLDIRWSPGAVRRHARGEPDLILAWRAEAFR